MQIAEFDFKIGEYFVKFYSPWIFIILWFSIVDFLHNFISWTLVFTQSYNIIYVIDFCLEFLPANGSKLTGWKKWRQRMTMEVLEKITKEDEGYSNNGGGKKMLGEKINRNVLEHV